MDLIAFPNDESFFIRRWHGRVLFDRLIEACLPEDTAAVEHAKGSGSLFLDGSNRDQARRIASLLVAVSVKLECEWSHSDVELDRNVAATLPELRALVQEFLNGTATSA